MQVSFVSALTNPASTFAVIAITEHDLGVNEVAATVKTREFGTLRYERYDEVSSALNLFNNEIKLSASFGKKVLVLSQLFQ